MSIFTRSKTALKMLDLSRVYPVFVFVLLYSYTLCVCVYLFLFERYGMVPSIVNAAVLLIIVISLYLSYGKSGNILK